MSVYQIPGIDITYQEAVQAITKGHATTEQINTICNQYNLTPEQFYKDFKGGTAYQFLRNSDGTITTIGGVSSDAITSGGGSAIEQTINSNAGGTATKVATKTLTPVNTTLNAGGKITATTEMAHIGGQYVTSGTFSIGTIGAAAAAVGTGLKLGKTFDSTLYNLNPDFWDEHNMSTLNPETWSSITSDISPDDPWYVRAGGVGLTAMLGIGVDTPDTPNTTQMYLDEDTIAYMAAYLQQTGVFDPPQTVITPPSGINVDAVNNPFAFSQVSPGEQNIFTDLYDIETILNLTNYNDPVYITAIYETYEDRPGVTAIHGRYIIASKSQFTTSFGTGAYNDIAGFPVYYIESAFNYLPGEFHIGNNPLIIPFEDLTGDDITNIASALVWGTQSTQGIQGVNTQTGATVPDLSNITEIADVLTALKNQLPDLFDDSKGIKQTIIDENGNEIEKNYYPVPMPDIDLDNLTQPTGDGQYSGQSTPVIDPNNVPEEFLQQITKTILSYPEITPNPPDTGDGTTPAIVTPTGTAGAMFAVYNPTQSQINDFGAWLWSTNFVDQLLKMFNDPMQAIISLHKIFAAPSTGGSQNIYVGYLDSGVSSATVSAQYVDVDCGSVNVSEAFGNVFDYTQTKMSIYLPFIGIVPLNVSDVMRSSIHVVYHVDVLTGACLADVDITRDLGGGVLYQYSGDCAVHYPLSSGSYMGIVSSIISVAGGVAGSVMSGGALTPVLMGAAAGALNAHTDVARTGGLSGNAGAMGSKIPYLIISRPQSAMSTAYAALEGIGSNAYIPLSTCSGFVKIKEVQLSGVPALDNELTEIYTQLREGVIV